MDAGEVREPSTLKQHRQTCRGTGVFLAPGFTHLRGGADGHVLRRLEPDECLNETASVSIRPDETAPDSIRTRKIQP